MDIKEYLIIENNVVTNTVVWNGDTSIWTPPLNSICLLKENTPSKIWGVDSEKQEYVLQEVLGQGSIGFTWDGVCVTTNEEKPNRGIIKTTVID